MSIEHMVWIKFKPGVGQERQKQHMENLAALAETVPAIQAIRVGENFTDRAKGFTHGLIVTVATREDLPRYLNHPDHVKAAAPMKQDAEEVMAMDIEC